MQAGAGEAVELSMEEVGALLEEGKALGLQLKGLPKLISAMSAARAWNVRAARALRSGALTPLCLHGCLPRLLLTLCFFQRLETTWSVRRSIQRRTPDVPYIDYAQYRRQESLPAVCCFCDENEHWVVDFE